MKVCLFDAQPEAAKLWYELASTHDLILTVRDAWRPGTEIPSDTRLLVLDQSAFGAEFASEVLSICKSAEAVTLIISSGENLMVRPVVEMMRQGVYYVLEKPYGTERLDALIAELKGVADEIEASRKEHEHLAHLFQTLTHRERHVLDCVLAGDSNKEAAKKLKVSVRTVESRRAKVYRKLELKHVAELVRKIDRLGQLESFFSLEVEEKVKSRMVPRPYLQSLTDRKSDADVHAC